MPRNPVAELIARISDEQDKLSKSVLRHPNKEKYDTLVGQFQGLEMAKQLAMSLQEEDV